jgi:hypothetical protein
VVQDIDDKNVPKKQHYIIAKERQIRQIKAQVNYAYVDLVNFTLNIVKNFDDHEFCSYKEKISCK